MGSLMPRLNPGGTDTMDMDGLTTLATTGMERGPLSLNLFQSLMPRLNPGGTDTTDMDGLTTLATTGTERGLLTLNQPQRPKLSLGGTEIMDGDGHMVTTGVNWLNGMISID